MAFGKVKESSETQSFKRFIGICPVSVVAVNPTKEKMEELFNTTIQDNPVYLSDREINGEMVKQATINVILKPDVEKIGFDMPLISMKFFLQNKYRYNTNKDKVQVIDKYGRTTWVSVTDAKKNVISLNKNGQPLNIDKSYRPALVGEEELMNFIKAYLCIDDIIIWDSLTSSFIPNKKIAPEDCECRFDNLKKVFDNDFNEIIATIGLMPNNKVKVMLGVRANPENGNLYQAVCTKVFAKNNSSSTKLFQKEIENQIQYTATTNRPLSTQYECNPVHEFIQTPTEVKPVEQPTIEDPVDDLPW